MLQPPQTDELLESLLSSAPYGIMCFKALRNKQGKITDFECLLLNEAAEKMIDLTEAEMVGNTMMEKLPGNKEEGLFDKYCQVVESGEAASFEHHYKGEHFDNWFRIHAKKYGDGFTVSFLDITEFRQRAKELAESEARYRKLFNESMDSIFIVNNELLFLEINDSMINTFGYDPEQIRLLSLKDLFLEENDFWRFNREFYKKDKVEEFEAELKLAGDKTAVCLINLINLRLEENLINLYQGVIKDITRKKRAEEEILWAEKLSMTGKIARSIAHEVRNPLTNLSLALEQLKDAVPEEVDEAELYFNIIERNANRISTLVTELLDSSKPKSLQLKRQSLNDVLESALKLVKDRLKLQNMKLVQSYGKDLSPVALDSDQMKIALLNIFINAIEAMKPDDGILSVKTYQKDKCVIMEVTDNGKGIPRENLGKLFEPFFTAKKGGMGLGLTTFQNIIQSHLGKVSVNSEPGQGTTFIITFTV